MQSTLSHWEDLIIIYLITKGLQLNYPNIDTAIVSNKIKVTDSSTYFYFSTIARSGQSLNKLIRLTHTKHGQDHF